MAKIHQITILTKSNLINQTSARDTNASKRPSQLASSISSLIVCHLSKTAMNLCTKLSKVIWNVRSHMCIRISGNSREKMLKNINENSYPMIGPILWFNSIKSGPLFNFSYSFTWNHWVHNTVMITSDQRVNAYRSIAAHTISVISKYQHCHISDIATKKMFFFFVNVKVLRNVDGIFADDFKHRFRRKPRICECVLARRKESAKNWKTFNCKFRAITDFFRGILAAT